VQSSLSDDLTGGDLSRTAGSPRVCIDRVDWLRVAPVLHLLKTPALALQPSKLLVAYVMLAGITAWGLVLDGVWRVAAGGKPFAIVVADSIAALSRLSSSVLNWLGVTDTGVGLAEAFVGVITLPLAWWVDGESGMPGMQLFVLIWGLGAMIIKVLGIGTLSLLAGSEACSGESISVMQAWRGALKQAPKLFVSWISLVAAAVLLLIPGLLAGLLLRLPILDLAAGLSYGLLLIAGISATALLVAHFFASHMMPMAIAIDDDDVFDTVSRSINYSVMRPIKYLSCQLVGVVMIAVTMAVVLGLVAAGQNAVLAVAEAAAGHHARDLELGSRGLLFLRESLDQSDDWFVILVVAISTTLIMLGAWAIVLSTYSCVQAWIYLIIRRSADGANHHEIHGPGAAPGSTSGVGA